MPIDIQPNDGSALAMIPIDLELPENLHLKETIMGRSLTPPPDGGPELGPYCTNDGIISAAGHLEMYAEHKFQNILPTALAQIIAALTADEQAKTTIINDIIQAEADLQQKIQDPDIKAKIKDAVKKERTPLEKDLTLVLDRLESVTKISTDFPALMPNAHTKCFQMTYTHPDHGAANVVMRFGIIAQNCPIAAGAPNNLLQPAEYILYQLAKNYLEIPNNHVALLDIFARDAGAIKEDTSHLGSPETHTIVLWKKSDSKIFVIDPNQKTFSNFVVRTLQALDEDINNEPALSTTFYKNNYLLETGEPKIGRGAGYLRDCIDIAIKAGFELNRLVGHDSDEEILKKLYAKLSNEAIGNDFSKALKSVRDGHSTNQNKVANAESIQTFLNDAKYKLVKK